MFATKFKNCVKPVEPKDYRGEITHNYYTYDRPSPYMFLWSRLLQTIVSLAGTKLITGDWHTDNCSIYKAEGGCRLPGIGDLVLVRDHCYLDRYGSLSDKEKNAEQKCAALISHIILNWDPNDPVNSMIEVAAIFVRSRPVDLENAIKKSKPAGGPFGGDALNRFFAHNPFCKFPLDRKYRRFCLMNHNRDGNLTKSEVDQIFADEDLGEDLLEQMRQAGRGKGEFSLGIQCCNPRREEDGSLIFWINGGEGFYGWFNEIEVHEIIRRLKNDEELKSLMEKDEE